MFKYCQVFQCMCNEVKDIIKGYDVVCDAKCHSCQECKEVKQEKIKE